MEVTNAPVVTFVLALEFQGDIKARRVWFYLCTVSPINKSTKSKTDSVEANAVTLNISARSIEVTGGFYFSLQVASKGDSNYDTFFSSVPELPTLEGGN